jgi:hypothetical protein
MSLYNAYLKSLIYALKRDISTDTFVIKRSINQVRGALEDMIDNEPETAKEILAYISEFLESELVMEKALFSTFTPMGSPSDHRIFNINVSKIVQLKEEIEVRFRKNV